MVEPITIVDYGLGNIKAFKNIYDSLNVGVVVAAEPSQIASAKRLILPGVGSFDWAISCLNSSGLREELDNAVLKNGVPVLGVCVGMQIMASRSEEGIMPGLGWLDAEILNLKGAIGSDLPIPHMGWNEVFPRKNDNLFCGLKSPLYYFLHSFYIKADSDDIVLASANYGEQITVAIKKLNIFGTQFHPEKSHRWGTDLLKNFALYNNA